MWSPSGAWRCTTRHRAVREGGDRGHRHARDPTGAARPARHRAHPRHPTAGHRGRRQELPAHPRPRHPLRSGRTAELRQLSAQAKKFGPLWERAEVLDALPRCYAVHPRNLRAAHSHPPRSWAGRNTQEQSEAASGSGHASRAASEETPWEKPAEHARLTLRAPSDPRVSLTSQQLSPAQSGPPSDGRGGGLSPALRSGQSLTGVPTGTGLTGAFTICTRQAHSLITSGMLQALHSHH
ncbi:hypothetical protein QF030_000276 [Streptomyces rishiriensis]|uniref:Uncharacterized protein n=1 Tax=Streptomyces rishiriensis TaxID=68264 RepID=A0ABU0NH03_STRRH|nr:hypothetical protein [Streptomyces rishiriensis]